MAAEAPGAALTALARLARTAAYGAASPFDAAFRRLRGRPPLPPLWLRRHTGPVGDFETAARQTAAWLERLGVLSDARLVLDAGCGAGAMVDALLESMPAGARYVGFDVHEPSIRWCRRRWARDERITFDLAKVASPYGARSGRSVSTYTFPVADGEADLVLAKSLFTHLLEDDARHYLGEIRRVLRPGRPAVVTAFLYEPDNADVARAFPHGAGAGVRVRSRARPTAAVAWEKARLLGLAAESGLRLQWHSEGYWPGKTARTAQDVLLLGV